MTPTLKIRSFTNDQFILDKVFYANSYKIRGFLEPEKKPVVLDLGAHCGYFTFTALSLGASKVYAFEPFTPNYKILLDNVGDSPIGRVVTYQLGVYVAPMRLTFNYPQLLDKSYFDFANIGFENNLSVPEFCHCCVQPLDVLLADYVGEQVDIMKLSIGYSEASIIDSSDLISTRVANVCGEISDNPEAQKRLQAVLFSKGFIDTEFYPITGENKAVYNSSKTNRKEVFN